MQRWIALFLTIALVIPGAATAQTAPDELVNLAHLQFLTESVTIDGRDMAIVHIYSEYPNYGWVDASGEGISAVDDVARAAVVYLWQYERTSDRHLLEQARRFLEFVRYMQAEDGAFYNFVLDREGTINRTGGTSYKSLEWWAMRALWALGEGVRVFASVDPAYANMLAESYQRTEAAVASLVTTPGEMTALYGLQIPSWLPNGAADSSAVGMLGMVAFYRARPNPTTAELITLIADALARFHYGTPDRYPFGMRPNATSAPTFWHDWGAHMGHALVEAGAALNRPDWIDAAAQEANTFLLRQLAFERFRNLGVVPDRLNQIAYGTNMLVQTYMALYRATGDVQYARYGGLAASWLFGNNMAGVQMYDPATGRVFDGLNGPTTWRVNRNSGAESTIEGLLSLLVVADVPAAADLLRVTTVEYRPWHILQAEDGMRVSGEPVYYRATWTGSSEASAGRYVGLGPGDVMELTVRIDVEDRYVLYVADQRQVQQARAERARALRVETPPNLDGVLDDPAWRNAPVLTSNTKEQFLRGSGGWRGPDVDSHALRLAWYASNLYLGVTVRDPQHDQPYTLNTAWQGDAMWVYLANEPDARTLSAKFTLAQTPDGPQVWDWVNAGFLAGARMAWAADPDGTGYTYEASVPWESLRIREPQPGAVIAIEAGRGIGGNSFMDLTGRDPDIASNLLPVELTDPGQGSVQANVAPPAPVFLRVEFGDLEPVLIAQSVSPDRDYWWLDWVIRQPVLLKPGNYTVRYSYAGADEDGISRLDAFYLQPAVARRTMRHPDGRLIILTYDTVSGAATWNETGP